MSNLPYALALKYFCIKKGDVLSAINEGRMAMPISSSFERSRTCSVRSR